MLGNVRRAGLRCRRRQWSRHHPSSPLTDAGVTDKIRRAVEQSIEVIRRRVDALGTTEPSIQREGSDRILRRGAGPGRIRRSLKDILGQTTAKLEFRLVAQPGESPRPRSSMMDQTESKPGKIPVEKRVMVRGRATSPTRTPGFDSQSSGQPIVNFQLQHPRRTALRPR